MIQTTDIRCVVTDANGMNADRLRMLSSFVDKLVGRDEDSQPTSLVLLSIFKGLVVDLDCRIGFAGVTPCFARKRMKYARMR